MRRPDRNPRLVLAAVALASLALGCTAPFKMMPATGDRRPDAVVDPDFPEVNCQINNTVDCRPEFGQ